MNNAALGIDGLDHATLRHLVQWLDYAVRDEDRVATQNAINAALKSEPGLIDEGRTWREIAERA